MCLHWASTGLISIPSKVQKGAFSFQSERWEREVRSVSHHSSLIKRNGLRSQLDPSSLIQATKQVAAPGGHPPGQRAWHRDSGRPSTDLQFPSPARSRGEGGILPSQLLWETWLSDQETRCLKQTKNTLRTEEKSMRDNVWGVINSQIWGEKEKSEDLFTLLKDNGEREGESRKTARCSDDKQCASSPVGRLGMHGPSMRAGQAGAALSHQRKTPWEPHSG